MEKVTPDPKISKSCTSSSLADSDAVTDDTVVSNLQQLFDDAAEGPLEGLWVRVQNQK